MSRRQQWIAAKSIDHHNGEWSYNVTSMRSSRFHVQPFRVFYEPFWDTSLLSNGVALSAALNNAFDRPVASVNIAFEAFEAIYDAPEGQVSIPSESERHVGSHSVPLVGWDLASESYVFRNSWGDRWGDEGYGQISREYLDRFGWDAWFSWNSLGSAAGGPPWSAISQIMELSNGGQSDHAAEVRRLWTSSGRSGVETGVGPNKDLTIRWRNHGSLVTLGDVDVAEVFQGGILVAWCMASELVHRTTNKRTLHMHEFFVWPTYRKMGIARTLMTSFMTFTDHWRPDQIDILLHNSDRIGLNLSELDGQDGLVMREGDSDWPPIFGIAEIEC